MIRPITLEDAENIAEIYNHYIDHSIATFEEEKLKGQDMQKRIESTIPTFPWLVFEENGQVLGYAYAGAWNERAAYRKSVESTIYLSPNAVGKGVGTNLYGALLELLKSENYHTVIGGISLPNKYSVGLHEKLGFKKAAHYKEVGYKFGKWIDVGYWQLFFSDK